MSESTVYRWKKRPVGDSLENLRNKMRGRHRDITPLDVGVAHIAKAAHPTSTSAEVSHVITTFTGQVHLPYGITRMLKDYNAYLTLNHMKIESHATGPHSRSLTRKPSKNTEQSATKCLSGQPALKVRLAASNKRDGNERAWAVNASFSNSNSRGCMG